MTMFSAPTNTDASIIKAASRKAASLYFGLHFMTMVPSRLQRGSMLKTARKLLTEKPTVQNKKKKMKYA
ncbi:hypothetical protein SAMN02910315_01825 [Methanobrevibacter millerae]|uniref:Uncharacterized protein n=1 Tax=Methanobrevibacter millerae TaxID=230361 RepID=A0A1G5WZD9_9EURY|nr:hypothetical protein SAMN02910315_01825 [Methanobrevibacter millerae]